MPTNYVRFLAKPRNFCPYEHSELTRHVPVHTRPAHHLTHFG